MSSCTSWFYYTDEADLVSSNSAAMKKSIYCGTSLTQRPILMQWLHYMMDIDNGLIQWKDPYININGLTKNCCKSTELPQSCTKPSTCPLIDERHKSNTNYHSSWHIQKVYLVRLPALRRSQRTWFWWREAAWCGVWLWWSRVGCRDVRYTCWP